MFLILPLVGWWGLTGMETPRQACTQDLCCYRATYNPIARRSIRPFLTGGHHRYTPVTGRVNETSASAVPSSAPTMRLSCASKASSDLPKATNTSPARVASAQGIERRSTKASGEKLSCAVLLTCAEGGALPSSLLSLLRRPMVSSCVLRGIAANLSRSCTHCCTAAKLAPPNPALLSCTIAASAAFFPFGFSVPSS